MTLLAKIQAILHYSRKCLGHSLSLISHCETPMPPSGINDICTPPPPPPGINDIHNSISMYLLNLVNVEFFPRGFMEVQNR